MKFLFNGLIAIGIFLGITLVIFAEIVFDMFGQTFEPSEILAGTLLGAGIALSGTLFAIYASVEADNAREQRRQKAEMLSVFAKMNEIRDDILKTASHFSQDDPRGFWNGGDGLKVRKPSRGFKRAVRFTETEKSVAMDLFNAQLFNEIVASERVSESHYFLVSEYEKVALAFEASLMSQPGLQVSGRTISGEVTIKQSDILFLHDIEAHIGRLVASCVPEVINAHEHVVEILNKKFGLRFGFEERLDIKGSVFSDDEIDGK